MSSFLSIFVARLSIFIFFIVRYLHLHSHRCPILRSFLFHFTHVHMNLFFFSLIFFFCAVIAIHCPCHLVDLYLFIVICIVLSIGAAVLNLISMFHVISNLISSVGFDVGLDRPVHLDHVLRFSLFINHHVIAYNVPRRIHYCVSFLVIVFIRFVGSFSLSTFIFRFVFISSCSYRLSSISVVLLPYV